MKSIRMAYSRGERSCDIPRQIDRSRRLHCSQSRSCCIDESHSPRLGRIAVTIIVNFLRRRSICRNTFRVLYFSAIYQLLHALLLSLHCCYERWQASRRQRSNTIDHSPIDEIPPSSSRFSNWPGIHSSSPPRCILRGFLLNLRFTSRTCDAILFH